MNAEMPCLPAALSVTAKTIAMSALRPVVMNCLAPFSTNLSPTRSARVVIAAASEPALRLGEAEGAEQLAAREGPQEALLLLRRAVAQDRQADQRVVHLKVVDVAPSAAAISMIASA